VATMPFSYFYDFFVFGLLSFSVFSFSFSSLKMGHCGKYHKELFQDSICNIQRPK
jgi:hypothetical protein